jgi:hypothetical protein
MILGCASLLGCDSAEESPLPPMVEPRDFCGEVAQSSAIIVAEIGEMGHRFEERAGPRELTRLQNVRTLRGTQMPAEFELEQMRGLIPNGNYLVPNHMPVFRPGERYLIHLLNRRWFFTPVAFENALLIGKLGNKSTDGAPRPLLITESGNFLTVDEDGRTGVGSEPVAKFSLDVRALFDPPVIRGAEVDLSHAMQVDDYLGLVDKCPVPPHGRFDEHADSWLVWNRLSLFGRGDRPTPDISDEEAAENPAMSLEYREPADPKGGSSNALRAATSESAARSSNPNPNAGGVGLPPSGYTVMRGFINAQDGREQL